MVTHATSRLPAGNLMPPPEQPVSSTRSRRHVPVAFTLAILLLLAVGGACSDSEEHEPTPTATVISATRGCDIRFTNANGQAGLANTASNRYSHRCNCNRRTIADSTDGSRDCCSQHPWRVEGGTSHL
jgi:hypothetical protein